MSDGLVQKMTIEERVTKLEQDLQYLTSLLDQMLQHLTIDFEEDS
jgi:hypothetical protein